MFGEVVDKPSGTDGGTLFEGDIFVERAECGEVVFVFEGEANGGALSGSAVGEVGDGAMLDHKASGRI